MFVATFLSYAARGCAPSHTRAGLCRPRLWAEATPRRNPRRKGRQDIFSAIVEPTRKEAMIGAIVLEDLDFLVDCQNQRLVPSDPRFIISPIEYLV
jgi:hypothetical protein